MKVNIKCRICGKQETGNWYDKLAQKLIDEKLCFSCEFWQGYVQKKDNPLIARIDGKHYCIKRDETSPAHLRGFSGRKFIIEFFDGRTVTTTNLWHQGTIPERFREELPDNARFIKEQSHRD